MRTRKSPGRFCRQRIGLGFRKSPRFLTPIRLAMYNMTRLSLKHFIGHSSFAGGAVDCSSYVPVRFHFKSELTFLNFKLPAPHFQTRFKPQLHSSTNWYWHGSQMHMYITVWRTNRKQQALSSNLGVLAMALGWRSHCSLCKVCRCCILHQSYMKYWPLEGRICQFGMSDFIFIFGWARVPWTDRET